MANDPQKTPGDGSTAERLGTGGIIGSLAGIGATLVALMSGAGKETFGWLRWLLLPVSGLLSGILGGYIQ